MKSRFLATCFATLTLLSVTAPLAEAAPRPGEPFAPEEWVPVARPAAVDRGPAPGSACVRRGEVAEYVDITGSRFDVEGVVTTSNTTGTATLPLTQTIKESKTKKWWTNISVSVKVSKELTRKYQWEYSREMIWSLGQKIGPYDVKPGETGRLSWGFLVDEFAGQTVRCGNDGKWQPIGRSYFGIAPRERHVEVTIN